MHKNLYICSTVRHLLFSVSKASNELSSPAIILFFKDYQNIEQDSIDVSTLPEHIQLVTLTRKELNKHFKQSLIGKIILACALRKLSLGALIQSKLLQLLNDFYPSFNLEKDNVTLFVFNERNKMSRLFRLLVEQYEMIEDGVGNYYKIPIKGYKKYIRAITGKPSDYWVFGEDNKCQRIHVVYPENLPEDVRSKGKKINFLTNKLGVENLNRVFKFHAEEMNTDVIIATQPTSKAYQSQYEDADFQIKIYQYMIDYCRKNRLKVAFKLHPSESIDTYQALYPDEVYLPTKQPLELVVLNCAATPNIMSINSTAGLGFENFCTRKSLILDEDTTRFGEIMLNWEKDPELLKKRIEELLN
ncbi:glycosyltransferase family 52 [Vibrio sp. F74]|uniref:glycosyltransferase family 52 n=1 Tax=Vibrio sp. F74 TaxID=700020 RepID=UPI0035F54EE8